MKEINLIVNTTLNAQIPNSEQFLVALTNQAIWNNFDLCFSDALGISPRFKFAESDFSRPFSSLCCSQGKTLSSLVVECSLTISGDSRLYELNT